MLSLKEYIVNEIAHDPNRSISFQRYMELALYHEQLGYYQREYIKIGKRGDFYTSVSVGDVFAKTVARSIRFYLDDRFSEDEEPLFVVEMGGGDGSLSAGILSFWEKKYPEWMKRVRYVMIEKSHFHLGLQQEKLKDYDVSWFADTDQAKEETGPIRGLIFSNELVDAFPVEAVTYHEGKWWQIRVGWNGEREQFEERLAPLEQEEIVAYLKEENVPQLEGMRVEVNLKARQWLNSVAKWLRSGFVMTIDYGWLNDQLYHPLRKQGTLVSYYRHQIVDPFERAGEQDITSQVNFSSLIRWGEELGLQKVSYQTQSQFLVEHGILELLEEHQDHDPFRSTAAKRNRAIRQLIMPEGMGEVFKVLVQQK